VFFGKIFQKLATDYTNSTKHFCAKKAAGAPLRGGKSPCHPIRVHSCRSVSKMLFSASSIFEGEALRIRSAKEHIMEFGLGGSLAGPPQHGLAEIHTDDNPIQTDPARSYQGIQAGSTAEIQNRGSGVKISE
jgi:hypothetical protein